VESHIFNKWFLILSFPISVLAGHHFQSSTPAYEITAHYARIHLFPSEGTIHCIDTVRFRRLGELSGSMQFGLSPLQNLEEVLVHGKRVQATRTQDGFSIESSEIGNEDQLIVVFSGPGAGNPEMSRMTPERAILHEDDIFVRGKHRYESVRLTVIVPREWETVAVGSLTSKWSSADSTVFVWTSAVSLPWIWTISAGKYKITSDTVRSVIFSFYTFVEDTIPAQRFLSLAERILKFYSEQFTPYRFSKLAVVEVDNWFAGPNVIANAMPSVILAKQAMLRTDDEINRLDVVLPHEIAHQWWPQSVYIRSEDVTFLSEGICEYATRLYDESTGVISSRTNWKSHPFLRPLIMRALHGKEVPLNRVADIRAVPTYYLKAAYIHHMLRSIVGDSAFRRIYHEFAARFQTKDAGLQEFQMVAEEVSHKSLGWFFDQWVKETGMPRLRLYNVKSMQSVNEWTVQGRVRIVGYKSYTIPVRIGVVTTTGIIHTSVWLGRDTSTSTIRDDLPFEIRAHSKPLRVVLDPGGDLLKIQKMPVRLSDLREPANGLMIVGTRRLAARLLELARRDSAELERSGWAIRIKPDTASTLSDYRGERVFLYGSPSMNTIAAQLRHRFPVDCDDGRCEWKEKVFADTALAITQIIENPFQENALLCWVVPLGDDAQPVLRPLDASAVVSRRGEVVESWTWDVKDDELEVELSQ
jgi:hypothetical protein